MQLGNHARKILFTIVGFALVVLGIILMPLPGPGIVVSVLGFYVLSREYVWAHRMLIVTKKRAHDSQVQAAQNTLTFTGQIVSGLVLLGFAGFVAFGPELPLLEPWSAGLIAVGGVFLLVSAIIARRKYGHLPKGAVEAVERASKS